MLTFMTDEQTLNSGETVQVPVRARDFSGMEGYQFTLQTSGLEFAGVEAGVIDVSMDNFGVFGNTLTTSWHKAGGVEAGPEDILFTLTFRAIAPGLLSEMLSLNSAMTPAEAYTLGEDIQDIALTFRSASAEGEFALYQNEPNPFKGTTVIGYDLPEAGDVTLTLFDISGKRCMSKSRLL